MKTHGYIRYLCVAVLILSTQSAWSAERFALVIGNGDYNEIGDLANPVNDARAVGERLDAFGFKRLDINGEVTKDILQDLDRLSFNRAVSSFVQTVRSARDVEMVFVYYAGHGMQRNSQPYLLPVDVPSGDVEVAFKQSLELNSLLSELDDLGDVTVAVFDACRDIPKLEDSTNRAGLNGISRKYRGLARLGSTGRSRLVAYAGAAGEVVSDGNGRHSPYTRILLKALEKPVLPIEQLFTDAAYQFQEESGGQSPEVLTQGLQANKYYFVHAEPESDTTQPTVSEQPATEAAGDSPASVQTAELPFDVYDRALWDEARQDNTEETYEIYLQRFPEGIFAGIAKSRMLKLRGEREQKEAQLAAQLKAESEEQQRQAQAEADRQALLLEQRRLEAARREQQEAVRLAAERAEEERLAAVRAEEARKEAERIAAERAEAERVAAAQAAEARRVEERLAADRAEAQRVEAERLAAVRAEAARKAAERAEAERVAAAQAEEARRVAERIAADRAEAERAVAERVAAERAKTERAAEERAAEERLAEAQRSENVAEGSERDRDDIKARMLAEYRQARAMRKALEQGQGMAPGELRRSGTSANDEPLQTQTEIAKSAESELRISRSWRRGLQVALNGAGIDVGLADGMFGARTRTGIAQWQEANGLNPTGYLNQEDYKLLVAELSVTPIEVLQDQQRPARQSFEPEMILIAGGRFSMGSENGESDERPVRTVSVDPFEIGKYEITFDQYDDYAKEKGISLPDDEGWGRGSRPVVNVSWNDALGYIRWLNAKTTGGYRLPSEAEWEYAARAGTSSHWNFGDTFSGIATHGNIEGTGDGYLKTAPVGSFSPNKLGLHDVHGNVIEWVYDCWHDSYVGAPTVSEAWVKSCSGTVRRVLRGGSWTGSASYARSAFRVAFRADFKLNHGGFRVARTVAK